MSDPLWHQALRQENYEPLEADEAAAVAHAATAILSRAGAAGRLSASDHREQFSDIGYEIGIRGWDADPPISRPELGGLTTYQLQPILQRAIKSSTKYLTATPSAAPRSTPTDDDTLRRIRERLNRRKGDNS